MTTLEQLSNDTFYNMHNYSQLIIDLVSDVEDLYTYEKSKDDFGALAYTIDNILEIIDRKRYDDIEALEILSNTLKSEIV